MYKRYEYYYIVQSEDWISDLKLLYEGILKVSGRQDTAEKFINKIITKTNILDTFPYIGINLENRSPKFKGLYGIMFNQYIIVYRIKKDTVVLETLLNTKKDIKK